MNFTFTPQQQAFRQEVRQFLERELPAVWQKMEEGLSLDKFWAILRQYSRNLGKKGWLTMSWPKEYGGQSRSAIEQLIFCEETAYRRVPVGGSIAVGVVGPTVMLFGSEEQKQDYLPRIANGEIDFCLCYSEPGAGSDLAAIQTQAVEDGDYYLINGQKIFTSLAHVAEYGWLGARTDSDVPKHKGISLFIVDMKTPGITVRPLIDMMGDHTFNEVFFDEVRVPKANLVGEKNRGWYQLAVALDLERSPNFSFFPVAQVYPVLDDLTRFVKETQQNGQPLSKNFMVRRKLAEMWIEFEVGRMLAYRIGWMLDKGIVANYEASIAKLYATELHQRVAHVGMEILGLYSQLAPRSKWTPLQGRIERNCLWAVSATIGAGTSEIQRTIIAIRGLGLPRG